MGAGNQHNDQGSRARDGKTLRRSQDRGTGENALPLVSAWAAEHRLVLAHVVTEETSHEMTVIPLFFQQ